ncbi:MAG: redox-sensitive transcriptional activator SoxR [Dermatophilaceae bacterium]
MHTQELMSIGEVGARSGFTASALRYYESRGLISAQRSAGGQRLFSRQTLRRLAFIRAAANVGLTLEEITAELSGLPAERTPSKADWQRISRHWRSRLDDQIDALERLRDGLDSCIGCGCLSLRRCAVANAADSVASSDDAPGAAFLPARLRRPAEPASGR